LSYNTTSIPIRDDLAASHKRVWRQISEPGTWLPWIAPEDAGPYMDEIFAATSSNIQRALSLMPAGATSFFDLVESQYLPRHQMRDFDNEFRAISHAQIEFIAGCVSALNQCVY